MHRVRRLARAFALYEVLLGMTIFSVGVLVLGRSVENCLRAITIASDEDRMRQILSNRMSEIQATPEIPDKTKETKINTGNGEMKLIQKCGPAGLKDEKDLEYGQLYLVTLTVEWTRTGQTEKKFIEFYVYRTG
jgi:hypothetical protein